MLSVAVLVHLSEPLRHLAWLGSNARKALMVFTPCHDASGSPHSSSKRPGLGVAARTSARLFDPVPRREPLLRRCKFPQCFDTTTLSEPLLRLAFEKMGFTARHRDHRRTGHHAAPLGGRTSRPARNPGRFPDRTSATPPREKGLEERDERLAAYVREHLSALQDTIVGHATRLNSLESPSKNALTDWKGWSGR